MYSPGRSVQLLCHLSPTSWFLWYPCPFYERARANMLTVHQILPSTAMAVQLIVPPIRSKSKHLCVALPLEFVISMFFLVSFTPALPLSHREFNLIKRRYYGVLQWNISTVPHRPVPCCFWSRWYPIRYSFIPRLCFLVLDSFRYMLAVNWAVWASTVSPSFHNTNSVILIIHVSSIIHHPSSIIHHPSSIIIVT